MAGSRRLCRRDLGLSRFHAAPGFRASHLTRQGREAFRSQCCASTAGKPEAVDLLKDGRCSLLPVAPNVLQDPLDLDDFGKGPDGTDGAILANALAVHLHIEVMFLMARWSSANNSGCV